MHSTRIVGRGVSTQSRFDQPDCGLLDARLVLISPSMSTKALLKTARDKIAKKDFEGARDASERVLDFESSNYTAYATHSPSSVHPTTTSYGSPSAMSS